MFMLQIQQRNENERRIENREIEQRQNYIYKDTNSFLALKPPRVSNNVYIHKYEVDKKGVVFPLTG